MRKFASKCIVCATLVLVFPFSSHAGFGDLGPYFSFNFGDVGDGGAIPPSVYNVTGQQISSDGQNVVLSGGLGPIDGASFNDGFVLYWNGGFAGSINPGDQFTVGLNFNVSVTGGTLEWALNSDLWSNEGMEDANVATDLAPLSSGQVVNASFDSSQFTQTGQTGLYEGYLNIDWSNYNPSDTLSINVNSIDITYDAVPEPRSINLAIVSCILLLFLRFGRRFYFRATH